MHEPRSCSAGNLAAKPPLTRHLRCDPRAFTLFDHYDDTPGQVRRRAEVPSLGDARRADGLKARDAVRRFRGNSGLQDRAARPNLNGGDAPGIQHQEPITMSATKNPSLFRQRRYDLVDELVLTDRVGLLVGDI